MSQKTVVIIGAGPAGLSCAHELLKTSDIRPIILEETDAIGGISQTIQYHGNRMDIGGHRFFSKDDHVMNWWRDIMPLQGAPASDDLLLNREKPYAAGGPDPEKQDRVMLFRNRISRILYLRKFFDYPISMKAQTFINMGFGRTMKAGFGYIGAKFHKRPEDSLENFMINRFGTALYQMFFEKYTEKVWGVHPSRISASWGAQRIKSLSLTKAVLDALKKPFEKKEDINQKDKETSLIGQFLYPKFGPGQLWETVADDVRKMGGDIRMNTRVVEVNVQEGRICSVTVETDGKREELAADCFVSSMPVSDLVTSLRGCEVPRDVYDTAKDLPFRDFITVGLLVDRLELKNTTKTPTVNNIVPDTWIYIQEADVKVGRMQIFNNWSPYMVSDPSKIWIGLEYFCNEGDELWNMSDEKFIAMAEDELSRIGVLRKENVRDAVRARIKKAYPAYFGTYEHFDIVRKYLDTIPNLYCVGRNGQHRYNNMDHSMLTAFKAAELIRTGSSDKSGLWSINSEESYHETKAGN